MPGDVAVEGPHAWIVGVVLQHHVPVRAQVVRVAPERVGGVYDGGAVPLVVAFV